MSKPDHEQRLAALEKAVAGLIEVAENQFNDIDRKLTDFRDLHGLISRKFKAGDEMVNAHSDLLRVFHEQFTAMEKAYTTHCNLHEVTKTRLDIQDAKIRALREIIDELIAMTTELKEEEIRDKQHNIDVTQSILRITAALKELNSDKENS